ncbi:MAG: VWA domain-containing protein [Deltaproteobacteria bacterium]|nr:MAG: VWA domain-containing protein [Deltaproteobacteria bacterium]
MHDPPLLLQIATLRDHVLTRHEETVNQVLVALQPTDLLDIGPNRANIVLVLDDSGSMTGQPIEQVLAATRAIIDQLGPRDQLAIVGFADDAELVHPLAPLSRRDSLLRVTDPYIWSHGRRGYGTNMALGLRRAREELRRQNDPGRINRIIVLTDGFASNPDHTLDIAREIAAQRIAIVSLGFGGDFDMAFMDQIAAPSGGACEYIDPRHMDAAIRRFLDHLSAIQDQLTDNARISLSFRGDHRVTDFYQTWPRTICYGLARLDADRRWSHRLADVERKQGLEMLFTVIHPADRPGRKLVADVEVRFDIPAAGRFDEVLTGRITVEYGDDEARFLEVDQRVQRRYNDAFVEKQQLRARQLVEAGDNAAAGRVLGTIRKRGNPEVRELAEGTLRKLEQQGGVDRESLYRLKMGTQRKRPPEEREPLPDDEGSP